MVLISSIILTKTGSRWPTSGCDMALSTEGATSLGPGPINRRGGAVNFSGICMGKTYDGRRGGINAIAPLAARRSGNPICNRIIACFDLWRPLRRSHRQESQQPTASSSCARFTALAEIWRERRPMSDEKDPTSPGLSRRGFLKGIGVSTAAAGVITAVKRIAEAAANDKGVVGPGGVPITLKVNGQNKS